MEILFAGIVLIGVLGAGLLLAFPAFIIRGWVITVLWGWFIVPFFHLPDISVAVAVSLCLIYGLFTMGLHATSSNSDDDSPAFRWGVLIGYYVAPLFVLLIGWIVHQFLM